MVRYESPETVYLSLYFGTGLINIYKISLQVLQIYAQLIPHLTLVMIRGKYPLVMIGGGGHKVPPLYFYL